MIVDSFISVLISFCPFVFNNDYIQLGEAISSQMNFQSLP